MYWEQQKSKNLSTHDSQKEKCLGQGVMRWGGGGGHVVNNREQNFTYTTRLIKTKISFEAKKKLICQFIFQ